MMKAVVVGGYSQGGTVAIDAALERQDKGIGSLVVVASSPFDNSPSMGRSKHFDGTRLRLITASNDVWYPGGAAAGKLNSLVGKYKLTKVGSFPEVLSGSHLLFDEGTSARNRIHDVLREELRTV